MTLDKLPVGQTRRIAAVGGQGVSSPGRYRDWPASLIQAPQSGSSAAAGTLVTVYQTPDQR